MLSDRDFDYRLPARALIWEIVGTLASILFGIALTISGVSAIISGRPLVGYLALVGPAIGIVACRRAIREVLGFRGLAMKGLIQVTGAGLTAADNKGETQTLRWNEVTVAIERPSRWSAFGPQPSCRLEVRGGGKSVRIYRTVRDYDHLLEAVLDHAGLVKVDSSWWGTRYIRPVPGIDSR